MRTSDFGQYSVQRCRNGSINLMDGEMSLFRIWRRRLLPFLIAVNRVFIRELINTLFPSSKFVAFGDDYYVVIYSKKVRFVGYNEVINASYERDKFSEFVVQLDRMLTEKHSEIKFSGDERGNYAMKVCRLSGGIFEIKLTKDLSNWWINIYPGEVAIFINEYWNASSQIE